MKKTRVTNVTVSLPVELKHALHVFVGKRGLSQFVAKAIERELAKERMSLQQEYIEASKDVDRQKVIDDWRDL